MSTNHSKHLSPLWTSAFDSYLHALFLLLTSILTNCSAFFFNMFYLNILLIKSDILMMACLFPRTDADKSSSPFTVKSVLIQSALPYRSRGACPICCKGWLKWHKSNRSTNHFTGATGQWQPPVFQDIHVLWIPVADMPCKMLHCLFLNTSLLSRTVNHQWSNKMWPGLLLHI